MTQPTQEAKRLRERLPAEALDLLDCKDGKYSEWATANALAMHSLNVGFSEDEFVSVVLGSDFACEFASENGRDRSNRLESRLRKVWAKAEDAWNPPLGSRDDVRKRLAALAGVVESCQWKGRQGVTDRKTALALIDYGHGNGAWTFNMSARRLGELAGITKDTASRSLRRLVSIGFLHRQESAADDPCSAAGWVINLEWTPRRDTTNTYKPLPPREDYVYRSCPFDHPVFLSGGLGPTAGRVWYELSEASSVTAAETAERLKLSTKTARRTLDRLVEVGLAEKSDGRPAQYSLVPVSDDRLNELAEQFGTLDWYERKAQEHQDHRNGYVTYLAFGSVGEVVETEPLEPEESDRQRDESEALMMQLAGI